MTDDDVVKLAREWLDKTDCDDAASYADVLARAVLAQHERIEQLRAALREALRGCVEGDITSMRIEALRKLAEGES